MADLRGGGHFQTQKNVIFMGKKIIFRKKGIKKVIWPPLRKKCSKKISCPPLLIEF